MDEQRGIWAMTSRACIRRLVYVLSLLAIVIPGLLIPPSPADVQVLASTALAYNVYLPYIEQNSAFNPQNRQESLNFYLQQYLSSEGTPIGWTGDHDSCTPGTTSLQFREAVLRRINYFREMAGVPTVTLKDEYNRKAQAAALMMSVNRRLSHSPTPDWLCYSSDGAEGAGSSDLFLGVMGWDAITGYVLEGGVVGHRRWILYPQTEEMGTGDIPSTQDYPEANALWVFDSNLWSPRPATRNGFVAWPPPGYVPYQVVNDHWSLSYPDADFSSATVTMTTGGADVPVALEPIFNGYGENTLVWIPYGVSIDITWPKPQVDTSFRVKVQNVIIEGQSRNFNYEVIVFDPTP